MLTKTAKTFSVVAILCFASMACAVIAKSGAPGLSIVQVYTSTTVPTCTLQITARSTTLNLTQDDIANYIDQGYLTVLTGEANLTTSGGGTITMNQYQGVSVLDLIHLVCELQPTSNITLIGSGNYKTYYNYTRDASNNIVSALDSIQTYANASNLIYSGGSWYASLGVSSVPHDATETVILGYYINVVNTGNSNGPTSFAGWSTLAPGSGPLRNVVLGCGENHFTLSSQSNKDVTEIIVSNPGTLHVIPEFPFEAILGVVACFVAFGFLVARRLKPQLFA